MEKEKLKEFVLHLINKYEVIYGMDMVPKLLDQVVDQDMAREIMRGFQTFPPEVIVRELMNEHQCKVVVYRKPSIPDRDKFIIFHAKTSCLAIHP